MYRDTNNLPNKGHSKEIGHARIIEQGNVPEYESYESMTKEELIRELVKARINEARLKKGYEVKGDGAEKVFVPFGSKNTK
jgi:transposase